MSTDSPETSAATAVKSLRQERERLLREIDALRNKVAGIDLALELISAAPPRVAPSSRSKVRVTPLILDLLGAAGAEGLSARNLVERAAERGLALKRGSVNTLLNRMTKSGTTLREQGRYRLAGMKTPPSSR